MKGVFPSKLRNAPRSENVKRIRGVDTQYTRGVFTAQVEEFDENNAVSRMDILRVDIDNDADIKEEDVLVISQQTYKAAEIVEYPTSRHTTIKLRKLDSDNGADK